MTDKTKNRIRIVYRTVLSLMLAVSGILLIFSCVSIYNLGDRPFTPENISNAFSPISIPIYVTVALVALGLIGEFFAKKEKTTPKAFVSKSTLAKRLESKLDASLCSDEIAKSISTAKKRISVTRAVFIAISVVAFIPALVYVLLPSTYTLEYNQSIINACLFVLPCALISALSQIILSHLDSTNHDKLISILKQAVASGAQKESKKSDGENESKLTCRFTLAARVAVLVVSVVFIIEGVTNGGLSDVLIKAINICTECIGLG